LRMPLEVRRALAYVLLNRRRHCVQRTGRARIGLDSASSGRWFDGWQRQLRAGPSPAEAREVAAAQTWLLRIGWRRYGLVDPAEIPGFSAAEKGVISQSG
jgi:hypothetical protein